jgi:hypothetical protein
VFGIGDMVVGRLLGGRCLLAGRGLRVEEAHAVGVYPLPVCLFQGKATKGR